MCTICDLDIDFAIEHPSTLSVAVATRRAIDDGALPAPPDDPPGALGALRARTRAIEALRSIQDRLERSLSVERLVALPDFFVLVVETRTWGFFRATAAGFNPDCRPEAPRLVGVNFAERDAVVLISVATVNEVSSGRLSFEQAEAQGLIAIDASDDRRDALAEAWRGAYPKVGFSRFVCA